MTSTAAPRAPNTHTQSLALYAVCVGSANSPPHDRHHTALPNDPSEKMYCASQWGQFVVTGTSCGPCGRASCYGKHSMYLTAVPAIAIPKNGPSAAKGKHMKRFVIATIVHCLMVVPAPAAAKRPITLDDFFKLKRVSDPQISPDGKHVVYV